jgi:phosphatidylinositol 4-kinase B
MQLISYYAKAFQEANVPVWLRTYKILSTSKSTGLIELIPDSTSLDGLKKRADFPGNLRSWYEQAFGYDATATEQNPTFTAAMENYIASLAGYSIVCYLLGIKDRLE